MTRAERIQANRLEKRKHTQALENIQLDLMDANNKIEDLYSDLEKVVILLQQTVNFTKGKLKYDSDNLSKQIAERYKLINVLV